MTIGEMLQQSVILTVLGMTIVFVFLWLMIVCINFVGKVVHLAGLDKDIQSQKKEKPKNTRGTVTPEITAAITGAVAEYRKKEQDHE